MFPGARVLHLCYNEARVYTTVRRAKQRVYTTEEQRNRFSYPESLMTLTPYFGKFHSFSHIYRQKVNKNDITGMFCTLSRSPCFLFVEDGAILCC